MMKTQFLAFLSFGCVLASMAASTNDISPYALVYDDKAYDGINEKFRRIDVLWADYTNRMERVEKMRQKRKEKSAPKTNMPPTSPLRFVKPSRTGRRVK